VALPDHESRIYSTFYVIDRGVESFKLLGGIYSAPSASFVYFAVGHNANYLQPEQSRIGRNVVDPRASICKYVTVSKQNAQLHLCAGRILGMNEGHRWMRLTSIA
jgi:hypothetical protein